MKKIIISLTFLIISASDPLLAQNVSIPDSIFKSKLLILGIDTNQDEEISFDEAKDVIHLDIRAMELHPQDFIFMDTIRSLKGIEAFVNLEELNCGGNKIDTIDLINNQKLKILSAYDNEHLKHVDIYDNILLEELELSNNYKLLSIDLTSLVNLKKLNISGSNISNLNLLSNVNLEILLMNAYISPTIDISSLANLKKLECTHSKLRILDLGNNPKLTSLKTNWSPLEEIIISGNDSLTDIGVNYGKLTTIDFTGAPNVKNISCVINNLTSINVVGLKHLITLHCNINQLDTINISNNSSLFSFTCSDNNLKEIIFKNNASLEFLYCDDNNLTNFDFENVPNISKVECRRNLIENLTINHSKLKTLFIDENPHLKFLDITQSKSIRNLQLLRMSQPIKVCVWEMPFPPMNDSIYVILAIDGSPDITFETCLENNPYSTQQNFQVYPNPVTNILQIEFDEQIVNGVELILFDPNGRAVLEKKYISNLREINLNMEAFNSGVYILELSIEGNKYFKKLIKN